MRPGPRCRGDDDGVDDDDADYEHVADDGDGNNAVIIILGMRGRHSW